MAGGSSGGCGGGGDGRKLLRTSLGALLLVGLTWFLLVGIIANKTIEGSTGIWLRKMKHLKSLRRMENVAPLAPIVVDVSMRRVPNGPDPIHNRHVQGSTLQPDQV
ncbi:hypothetical protein Ancab_034670 [Ancistrocladus abbreviatus]